MEQQLPWLPDECISLVHTCLQSVADQNSFSLACRRFREIDGRNRGTLKFGRGLHPANEAIADLCSRFTCLERVQIDYMGWVGKQGPQMNDDGLRVLATRTRQLDELSLQFCGFITDAGLAHLCACSTLRKLSLVFTPGVTGRGLLSVVSGCQLASLHIERCMGVRSSEWLEFLGVNRSQQFQREMHQRMAEVGSMDLELAGHFPREASPASFAERKSNAARQGQPLQRLSVRNCRGIGEGDLAKLGQAWEELEELHFELDMYPREVLVWPIVAYDYLENAKFSKLRVVHLANYTQRTRGSGLMTVLTTCQGLEELSLTACFLSEEDLELILVQCEKLKVLRLRLANLSRSTLQHIAEHCRSLKTLDLGPTDSQHPLCPEGEIDSAFAGIVDRCHSLQDLTIEGADSLTWTGLWAISQAPSLRRLRLRQCQGLRDMPSEEQGAWGFEGLRTLEVSQCFGVSDSSLECVLSRAEHIQVLQGAV